jgi:hypothetical protein
MSARRPANVRAAVAILAASFAMLASSGTLGVTAVNAASGPSWWRLNSTSAPTFLPRTGEGQLVVTASNLGYGEVDAPGEPVEFTDELPSGVTPVAVEPQGSGLSCSAPQGQLITCTSTTALPPAERLLMRITVKMQEPVQSPLLNVIKIDGGETPPATLSKRLKSVKAPTQFGVESYELTPEDEGGSLDTQAGSHPFQLTTTLDLNQTLEDYPVLDKQPAGWYPSAPALARDLNFKLPPGLLGDATAVARCTDVQFSTVVAGQISRNLCPADTAVGVATVLINDPIPVGFVSKVVPVFNLVPGPGEPARFGLEIEEVLVVLKTAVPTGREYGVEVTVSNTSEAAQLLSSQVTLWGVPGDPRHDQTRGWQCLNNGAAVEGAESSLPCEPSDEQSPKAFLTLPTSCERAPETMVSGESWAVGASQPAVQLAPENTTYTFTSPLTGCNALEFDPSIDVQPETQQGSTPTGLDATVKMPQAGLIAANGTAEPALKRTTVTLPEGLQLNPSAANGLETCAASQFGFDFPGEPETEQTKNLRFEPASPDCPDAAKVGTVTARTPLLPDESTGSLYLATQGTNPFQAPLVLYLVAEDKTAGVLIKLAGSVTPLPSGQVSTTFENTPQVALFEELKLHFFGGERAALSTPAKCGSYAAATSFTAWSGEVREPLSEPSFQIVSGPGGSPCASPLVFSPGFTAGVDGTQAGSYSPLRFNVGRPDGDQALSGITLRLPPGEAAMLSHVAPCPEPPAGQEWSCGTVSLLGHAKETAGLGNEPVMLTGEVFLTTGYGGAPFGVLVRTHAAAGPFDLGIVNVRSRIDVDPHTAAATITTDPGPRDEAIPTILDGVPVQLKALEVVVDRPEFSFNPTNCSPMSITGTLDGSEGAVDLLSYPFNASNCASLPFKPTFTAFTTGHASKANGASLIVKVTSAGLGQANIAKTTVTLPKMLPSRLTTIQKACLAAVFEANPASCPEGSNVGSATIHTPIFQNPLSGPAYLVSHGGAAFPDVEFVLQGEGVKIVLDGQTDIKKGVTTASFNAVPDAPFTSFETVFPTGPHSALTANVPEKAKYSLCGQKLSMPTMITGQNGAVIEQSTKVTIQGCAAVKSSRAKKLTRKQRLALALKACRKQHKHSKVKRISCEKQARKKYAANEATHHKKPGTADQKKKA